MAPRLYFMTVKDMLRVNPRRQTIGFVNDLVKRDSDHYFIVKEKNKVTDGFHFHAVFSARDEHVQCKWNRKGMHIYVHPVGDLAPRDPDFPRERWDYDHRADAKEADVAERGEIVVMADNMVKAGKARVRAKTKKEGHVGRCVVYLMKEVPPNPVKYVDYIYVKKAKP